MKGILTKQMFK